MNSIRIGLLKAILAGQCGLFVWNCTAAHTLLVEAESFSRRGGWVVDPQFMDLMGSPYLLAHGLGLPVEDAVATVDFPAKGNYQVFIRTMDWVARWNAPGAPGRFQLMVNGQPLPTLFGTEGANWHWQKGGTVTITNRRVILALHDLTGFEGRCDALFFTSDTKSKAPPNSDPDMAIFRRRMLDYPEEPQSGSDYDFIVTGGGIAGMCAAVSAARLGLKVALVQDRPVLGGNNSSEVRVWLQGARNKEPYPRVGDVVAELEQEHRAHYGPANTAALYEDEKKLAVVRAEPNIHLFLEHRVNGVVTNANQLEGVIAQDIVSGRRLFLRGRWFADCTGDGAVGYLAGAAFHMTRLGHMGPCNLWNVIETPAPVSFPRCPWALDLSNSPFPGRHPSKPDPLKLGGWYWESGFSHDPIAKMEYVRDWNFRAMYGAWDAIKNVDRTLPNHKLNWCAYILGKRESRRLLGDVILTRKDLEGTRGFADACVPTGWKIDLHLPDPRYEKGHEGDAFIAKAEFGPYPQPFWVPYRCLYSRNIANLFMAGRDISVTHEALGAVRVMRTGGCMGEIVGMAASLCKKHDVNPRAIYEHYFSDLKQLMLRGVGKHPDANPSYINQGEVRRSSTAPKIVLNPPPWLQSAEHNLARTASVQVSGSRDAQGHPPALLTDGRFNLRENKQRWLSHEQTPNWIEFTWDQAQTVNAARIISGFRDSNGNVVSPIQDFQFQFHVGQDWRDVPKAAGQGNRRVDWQAMFAPVTSQKFRLWITSTHMNVSRIWEVELYLVNEE